MPRSVFLGRSVGEGEPLWLDDDRAWAMALMQVEADTCSGCGQPRSETMAVKIDSRGRKVPAHTYEAHALVCAACRARDAVASDTGVDMGGRYFTVQKLT